MLMLLMAFAFQLAVLVRYSHSSELVPRDTDMKFYSDWGLRIANGALTDGKAFYGLPGYAYILGVFYWVIGFDPFTVGFVQAIAFALVAFVVFRLTLLVFPRREDMGNGAHPQVVAVLAALGWISFAPAQAFAVALMPTIFLVLVYWTLVWWVVRTRHASVVWPWLGMGLAVGVMSMIVATVLFAVPMVIFGMWRAVGVGRAWQPRLLRLAGALGVFVAGVFAGSAPVSLHNYLVAHEPVMLSAHSGINFWIGNNPSATGYPKMPPGIRPSQEHLLQDSITVAEAASGRSLTRAEVSAFWSKNAHEYIREHFAEWLRLMGRKFVNFWNAYQYDDINTLTPLREQRITWPGLRFGFVAALGLVGMCGAVWQAPRSRWVAAAVLLHLCALLPVFITERYRLAAVPGLLIFAAWWVATVQARFAQRRWRAAFPLIACALPAAWFVSIPPADASVWWLDPFNAGVRALADGDLDRAEQKLATALAFAPDNAEAPYELGTLWLKRGDRSRAKSFYREALRLNPRHDGVLNNLGVMALEEHLPELAEKFILAGLAIEPRDASRHYLLARARIDRGDLAGAREALQTALRLAPGDPEFLKLQSQLAAPPAPPARNLQSPAP